MRFGLVVSCATLSLALAACNGETNGTDGARTAASASVGGSQPGAANDADPAAIDTIVLEDPNAGGAAPRLALDGIRFGRAVELWSVRLDGTSARVAHDFVIGPDYFGDGSNSSLVTHPVLGTQRLMIYADFADLANGGRSRFTDLAAAAAATTVQLEDAGLDGGDGLTEVPRNAALELRFTDLVDVDSMNPASLRMLVGDPTIVPYEARITPSSVYGGRKAQDGRFAPTRIVISLAARAVDASRSIVPIPVNPNGLPPSLGLAPNASLRIATVGTVLRNTGGAPIVPGGSVDLGSGSQDMLRLFRSGSGGSPHRGVLPDQDAPRLVARATTTIVDAPVQSFINPLWFEIPRIQFDAWGCAGPPAIGDIIRQPGLIAEVTDAGFDPVNGEVRSVLVQLLEFPSTWSGPGQFETDGIGPATYDAPYDALMDRTRVACLVSVSPAPLGAPSAPTRGVDPASTFQMRFNEPLALDSVGDLEAVVLGRFALPASGDLDSTHPIVSELHVDAAAESIIATPVLPLPHVQGTDERYWITPRLGVGAARDLAGNRLETSPGPIAMVLDSGAPTLRTRGRLWTLSSDDQGGVPGVAWAGQSTFNSVEERIDPRPVVRSRGEVDQSMPIIQTMTNFPGGVQTPLNPLGAKLQTSWRYCDMGLTLLDPSTTNIDVEGLWWAPVGGQVIADSFSEFEIRLGHSRFAPDEAISPSSQFPLYPNSGHRGTFDVNQVPEAPNEVVHPRSLGFTINPGDAEVTTGGQVIQPFPQNRTPGEPLRTMTWRDTEVRTRAASSNGGVEPRAYLTALGVQPPPYPIYPAGQVQTLGLPLLMEFSTWPDPLAMGLNAFDINLAANSSTRPYFRAFSAGGVNQAGSTVLIDPDLETSANGGFNPNSTPPGALTFGRDNSVYLGAADFVVRKSVAHSVWMDLGAPTATRQFAPPIVGIIGSVPGTDVRAAARFASAIDTITDQNDLDMSGLADCLEDAAPADLYGDYYAPPPIAGVVSRRVTLANPGITFAPNGTNSPDAWLNDLSGVSGARYVQMRLTFEANAATGETPSASAVGLAWQD